MPDNIEENQHALQENDDSRTSDISSIPIRIPEELKTVIDDLPSEQKSKIVRLFMSVENRWAGPLPRPQDLQGYENCIPGAANRILKLTEEQSGHRMRLETTNLQGQLKQSERGQLFAFIVAMSFLAGAVYLIAIGQAVAGSILGTIDLVALVTAFLGGKYQQRQDLKTKTGE